MKVPQLVLFSGENEREVEERILAIRDAYLKDPGIELAGIAYSSQVEAVSAPHRAFAVWRDREDAAKALVDRSRPGVSRAVCDRPLENVSFIFPGLGEHYVGMGRELYNAHPEFRKWVDYCCEYLAARPGIVIRPLITEENIGENIPDASRGFARMIGRDTTAARRQPLQTEIAHPLTFVLEFSVVQLLLLLGVRPQALLGHSLGEYVAGCISGVFTLEEALYIVATRARFIQEVPGGAMLAVQAGEKDLRAYLIQGVTVAAVNSDNSSVLAGPEKEIGRIAQHLMGTGIACRYVETGQAFHSELMESISPKVHQLLASISLRKPAIPFVSNVTGTWIKDDQAQDPEYWVRHMRNTVQFASGVDTLFKLGPQVILEVGPGQSLGTFVKQHRNCKREQAAATVSLMPYRHYAESELPTFLTALGRLWLAGININWNAWWNQHSPANPAGGVTP